MRRLVALLVLLAGQSGAETVLTTRTIRPAEIITAADVRLDHSVTEGAYTRLGVVIGQEARVALYPGRPVMKGSIGRPALVDRNQIVELVFDTGSLRIVTEGRALGRGGSGERIRVMNVSSRTVLFGTIAVDGSVEVTR